MSKDLTSIFTKMSFKPELLAGRTEEEVAQEAISELPGVEVVGALELRIVDADAFVAGMDAWFEKYLNKLVVDQ